MEVLLSRVTQHAVQYAIRSGVSITTGYAIKQCSRLLKEAPKGREREELMQLQLRLESKIRVISPSIDMIELIAARGNTSLESALSLTKDIRYEIQKLGVRLSNAANEEELLRRKSSRAKSREETDHELRAIVQQIKLLLARIEDAVPLINLAITTSGINLSTNLSGTISPSRLLQASTFLTSADSKYTGDPSRWQQVGPTYVLTLYMLFAGHASRPVDEDGVRETTWKEVIHKARVKLWRVPLEQLYSLPGEATDSDARSNTVRADAEAGEFAYQLAMVEDLDDDRVHTFEDDKPQPGPFDDVQNAGIRDVIPVHEVSKVFYADTGKILNIGGDGDSNSPVLLLKRDVHAEPPRRMLQRSQSRMSMQDEDLSNGAGEVDAQSEIDAQIERESAPPTPMKSSNGASHATSTTWRLPADLDPEWMALEVFTEEPDSDTESEPDETSRPSSSRADSGLTGALAHLNLRSSPSPISGAHNQVALSQGPALQFSPGKRAGPPIKSSLSLLEMLMKLAALQQFRQESHLAIEDELLNFFLEDSATAGAGSDKDYRQRLRHAATRRVGFDPYDESPVKRRGEDYIRNANDSPRGSPAPDDYPNELVYDDAYGYNDSLMQNPIPRLDFARPSVERAPSARNSSSPRLYQQTPSRTSTPGTSEDHRSAVHAKYNNSRPSPQGQPLATPPSTAKTRAAALRAQSEPKPRSPLHEVTTDDD
ncbi:hypothetical protein M409DRAFT_58389 [Zasmidium cellare ATCC 36951]|uniref:Ran-binding-domain-containing protein n=1 Tax=Zasmidium cellare ATCC 36951 TaxID=1080233 RepID=A0A6A6C5W4_ZASCE|nr:uncharacterized protein M409DRAFT_58389 [Zasmidium cellare ATCC 36951]KAF2162283.1 hypothetical protein M409DRAFT_58389 [Zasmidium cellare ATCC 36951]